MSNNAEVVRYLRRKTNNSFEEPVSWIGAEQRFVNALRNSGVNNLEEQYIIGTATYTTEYTDINGNDIIEKSFCELGEDQTPSDTTNFYKLVTTKYNEAIVSRDYYFENNTIKMPYKPEEVSFGDRSVQHPNVNTIYCDDTDVFAIADNTLKIYPSYTITQNDKLYFVRTDGTPDLLVLSKDTGYKFDTNNRKITKESITNHIHSNG